MARSLCPAGTKWDSLILTCVHPHKLLPPKPITGIPPVLQPASVAPTEIAPLVTLSVWVYVAVVMSGSVLVVLVLFGCRRLFSRSDRKVAKEAQCTDAPHPAPAAPPAPEGLPPAGLTANGHHPHHPSSPFGSYQNGGMEVGHSREEDTCVVEVSGYSSASRHVCNGNSRTEGAIPLPATELGGAALVTTKTVQCAH